MFFAVSYVMAQHWVQVGSGNGFMEASDLAVDLNGNTLATGYFTGIGNFGAINTISSGNSDIFLSKIDQTGNYQWVVTFGGVGTDRGNSIVVDNAGNSYVTGFFNDSIQIGSFNLVSEGAQDVFITKISPTGAVLWANKLGGAQADIGTSIAQLANGNIVVSGQFSGLVNFGSFGIQSLNNSIDVFVVVLNPTDGSLVWSKTGGSKFDDTAVDIACDALGNMNLTGMFSDTMQFDVLHPNTSTNNAYLIQFSATGTENWFRRIAGSTFVGVHALDCAPTGNVYITGDYLGTLSFFGSTPLSLSGSEFSKSFLAKYTSSGSVQWGEKLFSDHQIGTTALIVDTSENIWVGGNFECEFIQLQQFYDDGIFIALEGKDVFLSRYNANGVLGMAKHVPSDGNSNLNSLALSHLNSPNIAMSFSGATYVPTSNAFDTNNLNLWTSAGCNSNNGFCGDPNYGEFSAISTSTTDDFIVGNCIDPLRSPFDFYLRSGGICDRSKRALDLENGADTTQVCDINAPALSFDSLFCESFMSFTFSTNSTPLGNGFFQYEMISNNTSTNCSPNFSDSIVISAFGASPAIPTISDNLGININEINTNTIELCGNSNVVLFTADANQNSVSWYENNTLISNDTFAMASNTGNYQLLVTDSNGCQALNELMVIFYDSLPDFELRLDLPDTVVSCDNELEAINFLVFDSLTNPFGTNTCLGQFFSGTSINQYQVEGSVTTSPIVQQQSIFCGAIGSLLITDSGMVQVTIDVSIYNACDTLNVTFTDSILVVINPAPASTTFSFNITGPAYICPQDTIQLMGTGDTTFTWFGPNQVGSTDSIIYVFEAGTYSISFSYSDTNQYQCASSNSGIAEFNVQSYTPPVITVNQSLLCPGDSAILIASTSMANPSYNWQGPNGNIAINDSIISVGTFGDYYCVVSNAECALESNTISILQYTSPEINSSTGNVICDNESLTLFVDSVFATSVNWLSPLTGNNFTNTVNGPGNFQCEIVGCGILTTASFEVFADTNTVQISQLTVLCEDSSTSISMDSTYFDYQWSNGQSNQHTILVSDSGFYAVTVIDQNNCTHSDTIHISINQVFSTFNLSQDTVLCGGDSIQLSALSGLENWLWFPNLESSESIWVESNGNYTLKAIDTNGCASVSGTITILFKDTKLQLSEMDSLRICEGESVEVSVLNPGLVQVNWSNGSMNESSISLTETGDYFATAIDSSGCNLWSDTLSINTVSKPMAPSISDTLICWGQSFLISESDSSYLILKEVNTIQNLDSGYSIHYEPRESITSFMIWSELGGCLSDYVFFDVELINCEFEIPNVISPNYDGVNDYFDIENSPDSCFELQIFNRWGVLVFISNSANIKWDGHVSPSGTAAASGVYFYTLQYCDNKKQLRKGSFTLLR